jgi:hypothetical protein
MHALDEPQRRPFGAMPHTPEFRGKMNYLGSTTNFLETCEDHVPNFYSLFEVIKFVGLNPPHCYFHQ